MGLGLACPWHSLGLLNSTHENTTLLKLAKVTKTGLEIKLERTGVRLSSALPLWK